MVRTCIVCKKVGNKADNRSLHRFPRDILQKNMWVERLFLTERDILTVKDALVCSDHFAPDDLMENVSGRHFLKFNAVPKSVVVLASSDVILDKSHTVTPLRENNSAADDSTDKTSAVSLSNKKRMYRQMSSSSTLSASSTELENQPPSARRRKFSMPRYMGDIHSSDMSSPSKANLAWKVAKKVVRKQRKKLTFLQRQNRRLRNKVVCLTSLLTHLKDKYDISSSAESVIEATLPGSVAAIFKRMLKGSSHEKYSPLLRTFALTLNFYSPKAYDYVRNTFNDSLPHPRTLSKWYATIEGKPGFTQEALRAIKAKVATSTKQICVNLVLDEMYIMKKVEWTGKEVVGYINLGPKIDSDSIPEATQALVFMVVAMNDLWKIPVGYFFIESLTGSEKANLVRECLTFLSGINITVTSVTFDGAPANITMMKCLGADLSNPSSLTTYFIHPTTQQQVYLFLDACHMLKLVRNVFGDTSKIIVDANNQYIKWNYVQKLVAVQETEGLLAGTKLRPRHLQWLREKMRVKIAAQTLSRSVADALVYLENDAKMSDFIGSQPTSQFILLFNNLFDILNCRNFFAKYKYKKPISEKNWQDICKYFQFATNYILNLKLNNEPIVISGRKTGFLGFLVCIESLTCLFWNCVVVNPSLSFILTYKLSQDHIEIFFSAIRNHCGSNNNPTCRMFETCYKKLLIHTEVKGSKAANAIALDGTSILDCSSSITKNTDGEDLDKSDDYIEFTAALRDHDYLSSTAYYLSDYMQDVVAYISGFVVKAIQKKLTCKQCIAILEGKDSCSLLQSRKQYGKLRNASDFVVTICKQAEHTVKLTKVTAPTDYILKTKNIANKIINTTIRYLPLKTFDVFTEHNYDCEILKDHSISLTKLVLDKYVNVRLHHEFMKKQHSSSPRVRNLLTKSILFKNQ